LQDVNAHPPELEVPGTPYKLQAMGTMSEREVGSFVIFRLFLSVVYAVLLLLVMLLTH